MTRRLPTLALYAAMLFIAILATTHSASAQIRDGSGACGAQFAVCNDDTAPAVDAVTASSVCRDSFGCPNCQASNDMKSAVCARLYGSTGFCTCSPIEMRYSSRFGRLMPVCTLSGSCAIR